MGMKQRRCDKCKKRRRYIEGDNKENHGGWEFLDGLLICKWCLSNDKDDKIKSDEKILKTFSP
jgi:hypothetical protein